MVRLPQVNHNNYHWQSDIMIMNAGAAAIPAGTVTFQPGCSVTLSSLPPAGSVVLSTPNIACVGAVVGAAISSNNGQPLAVVTNEWADYNNDNQPDTLSNYGGFPSSFNPSYYPLQMYQNYTWNTGVNAQNPDANNNDTVTISYYNLTGSVVGSNQFTLSPNGSHSFYPPSAPSGFVGSGRGLGSLPFLSVVNQISTAAGTYGASTYSAIGGGTGNVSVPLFVNSYANWLGHSGSWSSAMQIQNVGSSTANATVYFYSASGSYVSQKTYPSIPVNSSVNVFPLYMTPDPLPTSFLGSAWVTSNQHIAVVVNTVVPGTTDDAFMTYSGLNR